MEFNNCKFCGKNTGKKYNIYCDGKCQIAWQNKDKVDRWLAGWNPTNKEVPDAIRRFLFNEADHKCTECGWNKINPKSGRCPLTIDHVDGDATNNTRNNLRVLCPNCHSLTPTYGGLNRGNGRTWRYQVAAVV